MSINKKRILFLTDLTNGDHSEDLWSIDVLCNDFDIEVSTLSNGLDIAHHFDGVVLRNVWPKGAEHMSEFNRSKNKFIEVAKSKNIRVYNTLDAKGDMYGKAHLFELLKEGYPVIPTVQTIAELDMLPTPKSGLYVSKPIDGFSTYGYKIISREDLVKANNKKIIQSHIFEPWLEPGIDFDCELSFYYVDSELIYCLAFAPSKVPDWPIPKLYVPNQDECNFAEKFVAWNTMSAGVQRIDALKIKDGSLLLLEIEDHSAWFSLPFIPEDTKKKFLSAFSDSVKRYLSN